MLTQKKICKYLLVAIVTMPQLALAESLNLEDKTKTCSSSPLVYEIGGHLILPPDLANTVALTFDDGPDDLGMTDQVLDALTDAQVPATFFINTNTHSPMLTSQIAQATLKRIRREGHTIGNHTATHPELAQLSTEEVALELDEVQDVVRFILGEENLGLTLMRAPYGRPFNPGYRAGEDAAGFCRVAHAVSSRAVHVYWDLDPRDWEVDNSEDVFNRVRDLIVSKSDGTPGGRGILLLHSNRPQTAKALPAILALLKEQKIDVVDLETYVALVHGAPSGQLLGS